MIYLRAEAERFSMDAFSIARVSTSMAADRSTRNGEAQIQSDAFSYRGA